MSESNTRFIRKVAVRSKHAECDKCKGWGRYPHLGKRSMQGNDLIDMSLERWYDQTSVCPGCNGLSKLHPIPLTEFYGREL
jgi:hypothetical protein